MLGVETPADEVPLVAFTERSHWPLAAPGGMSHLPCGNPLCAVAPDTGLPLSVLGAMLEEAVRGRKRTLYVARLCNGTEAAFDTAGHKAGESAPCDFTFFVSIELIYRSVGA